MVLRVLLAQPRWVAHLVAAVPGLAPRLRAPVVRALVVREPALPQHRVPVALHRLEQVVRQPRALVLVRVAAVRVVAGPET